MGAPLADSTGFKPLPSGIQPPNQTRPTSFRGRGVVRGGAAPAQRVPGPNQNHVASHPTPPQTGPAQTQDIFSPPPSVKPVAPKIPPKPRAF